MKHKSQVWRQEADGVEKRWLVLIEASPHWADFRLVEVVGSCPDGTPLFEGPKCSQELDPEKAKPTISGFVKWDGCTEAHMSGNSHMCDAAESVLAFGKVWAWAINQCHPAMIAAAKDEGQEADIEWEPVAL